jgi:hypothetical protein
MCSYTSIPGDRVRVLEVPGVLSLVGFGRTLAPRSDFEIEALRSFVGQRKIEPHPYLVIGERVGIKAGPMTGMEGMLVRKKSNFRVVLALDVIMKRVAVEVDAGVEAWSRRTLCRPVARQASLDPRPTQANRSAIYLHRLPSAGSVVGVVGELHEVPPLVDRSELPFEPRR